MPIIVKFEESGPRLEAGTYAMKCVGVREDWLENSQFGDGHVIRLTLQTTDVLGQDGQPVELEAMASFKFTPMAKLTGWLNALGVSAAPGTEFDLETAPLNHTCLAKIEVEDKGDKGQWNRIVDLMAPPRAQSARRAVLAPSAADEEESPTPEPSEKYEEAKLASSTQLQHVSHLLSDIGMEYGDLAREINLPDNPTMMRTPDVARAVDYLNERKAALAASK